MTNHWDAVCPIHMSKTKLIFLPNQHPVLFYLLLPMAPSFLHLRLIYVSIPDVLSVHVVSSGKQFPFLSTPPLPLFSNSPSPLIHSIPHSPALSHSGSGITLIFFPKCCSLCLELSPSPCYSHLHHQQLTLIQHPIDLSLNALPWKPSLTLLF